MKTLVPGFTKNLSGTGGYQEMEILYFILQKHVLLKSPVTSSKQMVAVLKLRLSKRSLYIIIIRIKGTIRSLRYSCVREIVGKITKRVSKYLKVESLMKLITKCASKMIYSFI